MVTPMTAEELAAALIGLYAYDRGSVGSGIHDEALRKRCIDHLAAMAPDARHRGVAGIVYSSFLDDESLAQGYGPEDAYHFLNWLDYAMGALL